MNFIFGLLFIITVTVGFIWSLTDKLPFQKTDEEVWRDGWLALVFIILFILFLVLSQI